MTNPRKNRGHQGLSELGQASLVDSGVVCCTMTLQSMTLLHKRWQVHTIISPGDVILIVSIRTLYCVHTVTSTLSMHFAECGPAVRWYTAAVVCVCGHGLLPGGLSPDSNSTAEQ